jgi:hypothetical protein
MMDPSTIQPWKRALNVPPVIIGFSLQPLAVAVDEALLQANGVTTFKISNPNPFAVWYRGWTGTAAAMPAIKGAGHYLLPGQCDINRSQYPDWIAAEPDDEVSFPILDGSGNYLYTGKRTRLIMIYGSGAL